MMEILLNHASHNYNFHSIKSENLSQGFLILPTVKPKIHSNIHVISADIHQETALTTYHKIQLSFEQWF